MNKKALTAIRTTSESSRILPVLGSDPEFFVVDESGEAIPAEKVFPSREEAIHGVLGMIFYDGYQAEFNIVEHPCRELLVCRVRDLLIRATEMAAYKGYKLRTIASVPVKREVVAACSPLVRMYGCNPDFNAHRGGEMNPPVANYHLRESRESGGHISIEMAPLDFGLLSPDSTVPLDRVLRFVRLLDTFVGIPSVLLGKSCIREEVRRREISGKAGTFRRRSRVDCTNVVVEYRVPSGFILRAMEIFHLLLGCARQAYNFLAAQPKVAALWEADEHVRGIIDEVDWEQAWLFYKKSLRPALAKLALKDNSLAFNEMYINLADYVLKGEVEFTQDVEKEWTCKGSYADGFKSHMAGRLYPNFTKVRETKVI